MANEEPLKDVEDWWSTAIINMSPGSIEFRGYPIQDLIGQISFPQMIWLLLRGDLPTPGQAKLLQAAMVASVDHGPHAPSIAIARMAATCGVGLNNAIASAANVLGDSHGGAGEQCMELFEAVRQGLHSAPLEEAVALALENHRAKHGKIIAGYGHRFHPIDPRVAPLLELIEQAAVRGVVSGAYAPIARGVEMVLQQQTRKKIPMNIDGVTAAIFCELGFAPPLGRGLFVLSRSVGILAHAWEQQQQGMRNKGPAPKRVKFTYTGEARRKLKQEDKP